MACYNGNTYTNWLHNHPQGRRPKNTGEITIFQYSSSLDVPSIGRHMAIHQKKHETCPIKLYKHPSSHKHGGDVMYLIISFAVLGWV